MKLIFKILFCILFLRSFIIAQHWKYLGLGNEKISAIAIDNKNTNVIYAGSSSDFSAGKVGGIFKSTNAGASWDTLVRGVTIRDIDIHPFDSKIIYATLGINYLTYAGIIKTTDAGSSWFWADSGISISSEKGPGVLAINPKHPDTLYVGTSGFFGGTIYKSTNGGKYWFRIDPDTGWVCRDSVCFDPLQNGVTAIAIDPSNPEILYAGTSWIGDVLKTTDGGKTWQTTGLSGGGIIKDIAINLKDTKTIYSATLRSGFYFSTDGGVNWLVQNEGLLDTIAIYKIQISKDEIDTQIFIAGNWKDGGIYHSIDNKNWKRIGVFGSLLGTIAVTKDKLYAGGFGIYVADINNLTPINDNFSPRNFVFLYQNYPNPFNSETVIKYYLPIKTSVSLELYNVLGQRVGILFQGVQNPGQHRFKLNGSSLSSGVYIYRLKSDIHILNKKLLIIK